MVTRTGALVASVVIIASSLAGAAAQPAAATTVTASQLTALLTVDDSTPPIAYDRDRFEHWIDADGDGCNTRYEVLIAQSTTPTTRHDGCKLSGGTWTSPYDGVVAHDVADVEIDHVVALAEAWRSGAWAWTDAQRRAFANDLGVPYALTVSSPSSNQSKADHDPARWLPPLQSYRCDYVIDWALVKVRWTLTVDSTERDALATQLSGSCGDRSVTLPAVVGPGAPGSTPSDPFPSGVTRLSGTDRYQTAIAVSRRYQPGVPVVFVATGRSFPDALAAAAAAGALGGPLLLTPPDTLRDDVRMEVTRLAPQRIVVVGGEAAVGRTVQAALNTIAPTVRVGGESRYDTARLIVEHGFVRSDVAFVATGRGFPDALAASGAAGSLRAPVVLVDGRAATAPGAVVTLLRAKGVQTVVLVGGTGALSQGIESRFRAQGFEVSRVGGADRYSTAASINDAFFRPGAAATAFVATGDNFPDALAGAALAGHTRSPMFVTRTTCVPDTVRVSMSALRAPSVAILGGTSAVDANAAAGYGCLESSMPRVTGTPQVGRTLLADAGTWTAGAALTYRWLADGKVLSGETAPTLTLRTAHAGKRIAVSVTGRKTGYVPTTRTSASTAAVSGGAPATPPDRTNPISTTDCPTWAPIKGNADSGIYHVPGQRFYARTHPEDCFRTEAAAVAAGYRRSQV